MKFRDFDGAAFLRDHWQQKPLVIRSPWENWSNPVEPDELAGLACEPLVESRLITVRDQDWELEHGPVPESRFAKAGRDPWTLLVQSVDHHFADVAALLDPFRFVPNWRIDDVMSAMRSTAAGSARISIITTCFWCRGWAGGAGNLAGCAMTTRPCSRMTGYACWQTSARPRSGSSSPATFSMCRRASRTAARRSGMIA